jgi:hypothetical protein
MYKIDDKIGVVFFNPKKLLKAKRKLKSILGSYKTQLIYEKRCILFKSPFESIDNNILVNWYREIGWSEDSLEKFYCLLQMTESEAKTIISLTYLSK